MSTMNCGARRRLDHMISKMTYKSLRNGLWTIGYLFWLILTIAQLLELTPPVEALSVWLPISGARTS